MKNLLYKEFRLVTHQTVYLFFCLSAMLLIPNYPYYVTFFYTSLALFFSCLTGRENNDIFYTVTLPVEKSDVVKARILFAVIIELVQFLIAVPFAMLRQSFNMPGNQVGMDANIAFFGFAFVMIGIFNILFFTMYYKSPDKVGKHFAIASVFEFLYMIIVETLSHIVPFMRDKLDTDDSRYLKEKLIVLAAGIVIFIILTAISIKRSQKTFEALDL